MHNRVIVNSTPLIVLANVNKLELLQQLYSRIVIPQAVYDEVTIKPHSSIRETISHSSWITVEKISNIQEKKMYQAKLHAGEVEVMILAQENPPADLVILDDNAAKKTAKYLGLKVTGTLGILVKAKKQKLLAEVKPVLDEIICNGFYLSSELYTLVLQEVGETH